MHRQALLWIPMPTAGRNHQAGDCRAVDSGPNPPQMCFVGLSSAGAEEQLSQGLQGLLKKHTVNTLSLLCVPPAGFALVVLGICVCILGSRSGPKVTHAQARNCSVSTSPYTDLREIGTGQTASNPKGNNQVLQFPFSILFEVW